MAVRLLWRPQAREDVLLIYEFIGRENPSAAAGFVAAIERKAELLAEYPRIGTGRSDIGPALVSCLKAIT
ncbi:MAG TPA: type II toxin-antitoxin system RelE/ParE family toxin [Candidatus Binataceae bacterium]|nr:type II toxin-antitoxin system RelE/ParE family toxin [Candidatus Binataceae bacterium]